MQDEAERARVALATGAGVVAVALGSGMSLPGNWAFNPRVMAIHAETLAIDQVRDVFPSTTRMVIFTGELERTLYTAMVAEASRRRLNYLTRRSGEHLDFELRRILTQKVDGEPREPRPMAPRGAIQTLIATHANLTPSTSTAEEAKRLFAIAQQEGITTTLGSIEQGVSKAKRRAGFGSRPASVSNSAVAAQVALVRAVDEAIIALTRIKESVQTLDEEQARLRRERDDLQAKIDLLRGALKDIE